MRYVLDDGMARDDRNYAAHSPMYFMHSELHVGLRAWRSAHEPSLWLTYGRYLLPGKSQGTQAGWKEPVSCSTQCCLFPVARANSEEGWIGQRSRMFGGIKIGKGELWPYRMAVLGQQDAALPPSCSLPAQPPLSLLILVAEAQQCVPLLRQRCKTCKSVHIYTVSR